MVATLTKGMQFTFQDPLGTGVFQLASSNQYVGLVVRRGLTVLFYLENYGYGKTDKHGAISLHQVLPLNLV